MPLCCTTRTSGRLRAGDRYRLVDGTAVNEDDLENALRQPSDDMRQIARLFKAGFTTLTGGSPAGNSRTAFTPGYAESICACDKWSPHAQHVRARFRHWLPAGA